MLSWFVSVDEVTDALGGCKLTEEMVETIPE